MFEKDISLETYKFLCLVYKEYIIRCDTLPKQVAAEFPDVPEIVYEYIKKEDCHECLVELRDNGLIRLYIDDGFLLNNSAIVVMENRFKKGFSEVADFVSKFIPKFIP